MKTFFCKPAPRDPEHSLLQIGGKKILTGVMDVCVSCQLICWLHNMQLDKIADNPYAQVALLLAIDGIIRVSTHMVERSEPLKKGIETGVSTSFNTLALVSGMICAAACSEESHHTSTDINSMTMGVVLSVALGMKFLLWDMDLVCKTVDKIKSMRSFESRNSSEDPSDTALINFNSIN